MAKVSVASQRRPPLCSPGATCDRIVGYSHRHKLDCDLSPLQASSARSGCTGLLDFSARSATSDRALFIFRLRRPRAMRNGDCWHKRSQPRPRLKPPGRTTPATARAGSPLPQSSQHHCSCRRGVPDDRQQQQRATLGGARLSVAGVLLACASLRALPRLESRDGWWRLALAALHLGNEGGRPAVRTPTGPY